MTVAGNEGVIKYVLFAVWHRENDDNGINSSSFINGHLFQFIGTTQIVALKLAFRQIRAQ
jgi:hypothetical protein